MKNLLSVNNKKTLPKANKFRILSFSFNTQKL